MLDLLNEKIDNHQVYVGKFQRARTTNGRLKVALAFLKGEKVQQDLFVAADMYAKIKELDPNTFDQSLEDLQDDILKLKTIEDRLRQDKAPTDIVREIGRPVDQMMQRGYGPAYLILGMAACHSANPAMVEEGRQYIEIACKVAYPKAIEIKGDFVSASNKREAQRYYAISGDMGLASSILKLGLSLRGENLPRAAFLIEQSAKKGETGAWLKAAEIYAKLKDQDNAKRCHRMSALAVVEKLETLSPNTKRTVQPVAHEVIRIASYAHNSDPSVGGKLLAVSIFNRKAHRVVERPSPVLKRDRGVSTGVCKVYKGSFRKPSEQQEQSSDRTSAGFNPKKLKV